MTQQSQQKWNVIQNILLFINKLWRQQHGRAVKKSVTGQVGGEKKDKWQHPQRLPMLQVETSL